jgi:hypothetical protein
MDVYLLRLVVWENGNTGKIIKPLSLLGKIGNGTISDFSVKKFLTHLGPFITWPKCSFATATGVESIPQSAK